MKKNYDCVPAPMSEGDSSGVESMGFGILTVHSLQRQISLTSVSEK
jgi:hypothetical protein